MTDEEIVRYVVAKAVWAPSVHNTQPWRFTADGGPGLSLHADAGRRLAVADPDGREMMISCGAALFTIDFLRTQLGDGACPHLVLRIGLVTQVALSVRREPGDVLFLAGDDRADRGTG